MPFSRNGGWTSLGLARDDDMNSYFKRMVQLINQDMKHAGQGLPGIEIYMTYHIRSNSCQSWIS